MAVIPFLTAIAFTEVIEPAFFEMSVPLSDGHSVFNNLTGIPAFSAGQIDWG